MAKSVVICSDGTGNTSTGGMSNVFRLVKLLALDDPERQVVMYDQGIGTPRHGLREAKALAGRHEGRALRVLPGPLLGLFGVLLRPVELAFSLGLSATSSSCIAHSSTATKKTTPSTSSASAAAPSPYARLRAWFIAAVSHRRTPPGSG